jgi:L-lactate dehydrogenase complex protein LldG
MPSRRSQPKLAGAALWDVFETKAVALSADVLRVGEAPSQEVAEGDFACRAELAIAETGSLLVILPQPERARALLAEHLWCQVRAEAIVATLDQALEHVSSAIANQGNHYATFMSGPSRTADIERTLTIGVHGPRALTIIVVGDTQP